MCIIISQLDEPLQSQQIRKPVLRAFGDELLPFPTSELPIFDFEKPTDFLTGERSARFALRDWLRMLRVVSQHRLMIAPIQNRR